MCGSRGGIGDVDPPEKSQVIWGSIEISILTPPGKSWTPPPPLEKCWTPSVIYGIIVWKVALYHFAPSGMDPPPPPPPMKKSWIRARSSFLRGSFPPTGAASEVMHFERREVIMAGMWRWSLDDVRCKQVAWCNANFTSILCFAYSELEYVINRL